MKWRGWEVETEGGESGPVLVVVHCPDGHEVPADGQGCPWCWRRTPGRILDEADRLRDEEGAI